MTEDNKRANIAAELDEAEIALQEAVVLYDNGLHKGAVSRAYYHVLHAARALLLSLGLEPKTHSGVSRQVSLQFVKTGRLDPRVASTLSSLEEDRFRGEYEAAVFTQDMAQDALQAAREYAAAVRALLSADGYLPS